MLKTVLILFILKSCVFCNIPSLPYCSEQYDSGLVIVSTLDGKVSALNSNGSLIWDLDAGPGPLLLSNIHNLELTNKGEWIRLIPSLTGILYKFDGFTIDPIPISTEELLKSSFVYSDDLVIAGGIEVRTYGIGFRTGTLIYECNSLKCSKNETNDEDVLLIERSTRTIRAVEPRTGSERWNFSVGLHNIKLPRISCINANLKLVWNFSTAIPEGKLWASIINNNVEHNWHYTFSSPIVRIWLWTGQELSEINIFSLENTPQVIPSTHPPSIYVGMHKKQLYIYESLDMQNQVEMLLNQKLNPDVAVIESNSIAKIPWKPVSASAQIFEEDSTALSVLNGSEYVNGYGFYLYTESKFKNTLLCEPNRSHIQQITSQHAAAAKEFYSHIFLWWKEIFLCLATSIIFHFLFRLWNRRQQRQEVIVLEKTVDDKILVPHLADIRKDTFCSRFENDFETVQCLGKGGFGVVFEVKQKIDECKYAIKRITLPNELKSRDRVMREVKALAKLDHQNIVRYFCSWVEYPPMGWQQEHDKQWIKDKSFEGFSSTPDYKVRRSKSVSVCIDIPLNTFDSGIPIPIDESDDDSFIVFEKTDYDDGEEENESHATACDETDHNQKTSAKNSVKTLNNSEICSNGMKEHLKKKIDWKKPNRHYSWDFSFNSNIALKPQKSPVYLYIQMQLCQKQSLKEWLTTHLERDKEIVIDIFSQILEAVEYVHLRGLIHRDLKPSNIFFSLSGQIKVGDFGLVKDVEDAFDLELIKNGTPPAYRGHTLEVGTQLYMSPEQFQSRIYDYKVDIYSLGLIFFELLVPFSTEMERIKTLTKVKKNVYSAEFVKQFPDEHILLQNMLCEDPNKRLTTIGIKVRPPLNREDSGYSEDYHYQLNSFTKTP